MAPNIEQIIHSIKQLPMPDRERLRKWLEDEGIAAKTGPNGEVNEDRSNSSLHWLNANRTNYLGRWVALDGDRLVAVGSTAREVYDGAKEVGIAVPFVELVTEEEMSPFIGGWLS